jgi:hypothetical protein
MTDEKAITQPITIYPTDRAIVEAVQKRNGTGFSGAVRFIIREWARNSGLQDTLHTDTIPLTKPRTSKPSASKRARKFDPDSIAGVRRGAKDDQHGK